MKKDFLLFGSSPAVIRSFDAAAARPVSNGETPILYVSLAALRTYVTERRDALIGFVVDQHQVSREHAGASSTTCWPPCNSSTASSSRSALNRNQVVLTLRVKTSQPLRKQ